MRREIVRLVIPLALALCSGWSLALGADELTLIVPAAEFGADASQVLLAIAWLNGDGGLVRDPVRAAHWFEQAALQGNAYAEERLGDLYEQGLGVPLNLRLAFDWRLKAADRGDVEAQLKVGRMYQQGAGVAKDLDRAIDWYQRAATEGSVEAQHLLAGLHHYGRDVEVEQAATRSWFEEAAQRGYQGVTRLLNLIENFTYRIDEVWHKRLPGLRKLAEDGDVEAEYQLARRYESGRGGVEKDAAAALEWYRRAAAGGHRMAKQVLAQTPLAVGEPVLRP